MSWIVSEQIAHAIAQDDEGRAYCEAPAPLLHRSQDDRDLIYKTKMNDAAEAESDAVTREDVWQMIEDATQIIGEETHKLTDELGDAELTKEVDRLRSLVDSGNVTPIARGRDGAIAA